MRILVLNYEYPPIGAGGGDASKFLAEGYAARGHKTFVLTAHWADLPREEKVSDYLLIKRIFAFRRDKDRCTPFQMLAFMLLGMPAALNAARHFRPDVVHLHFAIPVGPLGWLLKKMRGLPYVVTFQGGDVPGFVPDQTDKYFRLLMPVARAVVRNAARCAAVSEGLAALAREQFNDESIFSIPNGVDVEMFKPSAERQQDGPIRFAFAGRFNPQKALHNLVGAVEKVKKSGVCGFTVDIYGGGPLENELLALVERADVRDVINFHGWIGRKELADVLGRAHVFAMPSLIEGMPLACLQAMSSGLAIVGSRTMGIVEAVEEGRNGLLNEVGDEDGLAESMIQMINDRAKLTEMGQESRRIAIENYSWDVIVERYLELLSDLL